MWTKRSGTSGALWKYTGCLCSLRGQSIRGHQVGQEQWCLLLFGHWEKRQGESGRQAAPWGSPLPGKPMLCSFWGSRFLGFLLSSFRGWGQHFHWRETKIGDRLVTERRPVWKEGFKSGSLLRNLCRECPPSERDGLKPCQVHKDNDENTVLSVWRMFQKFVSKCYMEPFPTAST